MSPGYCVIRKGKTVTSFFDGRGWSLSPTAAKVFATWTVAWARARVSRGIVVLCWT